MAADMDADSTSRDGKYPLLNVTIPRPYSRCGYPPFPDPEPKIEIECDGCSCPMFEKQFSQRYFPLTLDCGHGFCTRCILSEVAPKQLCPICESELSHRHLEHINRQHRLWAISEAAEYWKEHSNKQYHAFCVAQAGEDWNEPDNIIRFRKPLADTDTNSGGCKKAAERAIAMLYKADDMKQTRGLALICPAKLGPHFVVMAKMLQAMRSVKREPFTNEQTQQWSRIIETFYGFLAEQAQKEDTLEASVLSEAMEQNLKESLKFVLEESGFTVPGTNQHRDMQLLLRYVLDVCRKAYKEWKASQRAREPNPKGSLAAKVLRNFSNGKLKE